MRVKYLLESGLFERRDIRSGRIYREGVAPEYGVIFTANASKSEDDSGLNPDLMLGVFIGGRDYSEGEKDRFFEILGGYFYHDNYPDLGVTTTVFGIALDPEFGITEGGTTTLKDKWKLDDPQKPILDESYWSKEFGKHHGWTFIVTLKEREQYPTSDEELKIFVYCPEIKDIEVTYGGCVTDNEVRRRKVSFTVSMEGSEPESWTWHFGDGSTKSGAGSPGSTIEHFYENKPDNAPRLCLIGRLPCEEICKEVDLSEFEKCLPCPEITNIKYKSIERDNESDKIEFISEVSRQPDEFEWDFGDGCPKEKTTESKISHEYKIPERDTIYNIKLTSYGPEDCQDTMNKKIIVKSDDITSKFCFWLKLIIAFLSATTCGTFIVYGVGKIFNQVQDFNWLVTLLVVQAFLTVIGIIAWYQIANKKKCPKPTKCDWIIIGWVAMLASMLDAFYVKSCCETWWWIVILIFLGLAGLLFFSWVKKCIVKAKEFVFYFIVCFLAVAGVCYFIAGRLLAHCLR